MRCGPSFSIIVRWLFSVGESAVELAGFDLAKYLPPGFRSRGGDDQKTA